MIGKFSFFAAAFLLLIPLNLFAADTFEDTLKKGIAEYRAENYEEAVELFKNARGKQPNSSIAAFYMGLVYKQTGNYRDAAVHYRDALNLKPPVMDAYTELIEVLYNLNELKEAREWIEKAEKENVRPAHISFLKGLLFAKEDENKEAISAFSKAKELEPSFAQSSDLQTAMIYAKERKLKEAQESLKRVIAIDPSTELATFARDYEISIARSLELYKPWRFSASVSYQYDDNVVSKPISFISANYDESVQQGGGREDDALLNSARIEFSPMLGGPWLLNAQYNISNTHYSTIDTLDVFLQGITVNPGYNFGRGAVTFPLSYNYVWLSGIRYMGLVSAKPTVSVLIAPSHIGQFSAGFSKKEMLRPGDPDEDRDSDIYSLSAGYIYQFSEGKGMINVKYEHTREDTDGRNWDNLGNKAGAVALVPVVDKLNFVATGDINVQQYKNTNTFSGGGLAGFPAAQVKRRDNTYSGSAGVIWEALKGLNVNVQYSHTRADSNFAVYDYKRNQYTLGIEYSF